MNQEVFVDSYPQTIGTETTLVSVVAFPRGADSVVAHVRSRMPYDGTSKNRADADREERLRRIRAVLSAVPKLRAEVAEAVALAIADRVPSLAPGGAPFETVASGAVLRCFRHADGALASRAAASRIPYVPTDSQRKYWEFKRRHGLRLPARCPA